MPDSEVLNMRKKTHQEFIDKLQKANENVIVIGTYVGYSTKIETKCVKCGHVWFAWPESLLKGHGCPICANNIKKTHESFVYEMHNYNPYIEIIDEYKTALTPIKVRCRICGNEWMAKPNRLLSGAQCMRCIRPHTSFMEQFILLALRHVLGNEAVESRNTNAIDLELDIYIPSAHLAIEPGSWLYHEKKVDNIDSVKREKCASAGIRLLTIYDTYPKNKVAPFDSDCFVFTGFLNEPGYGRLISLTKTILHELGHEEESCNWIKLAGDAYEACHYNANEAFIKDLSIVSPEIEPLEEYKGTNTPILVHSKECGHSAWRARPYTLLKGIGCPICGREKAAKTRVRTNVEFVDELYTINSNVKVISDYKAINKRVEVRCVICGHEWSPVAYSLLSGKGCPHCSAIEGAKKRAGRLAAKSNDQFIEEMSTINPAIEIIGGYINNKTKILARCLVCGNEWSVVPASLLNGHGCPVCARKKK